MFLNQHILWRSRAGIFAAMPHTAPKVYGPKEEMALDDSPISTPEHYLHGTRDRSTLSLLKMSKGPPNIFHLQHRFDHQLLIQRNSGRFPGPGKERVRVPSEPFFGLNSLISHVILINWCKSLNHKLS